MSTTFSTITYVLTVAAAGTLLLVGCSRAGTEVASPAGANEVVTGMDAATAEAPSASSLEAGEIVPEGMADSSFESGKWPYRVSDGTRYVVDVGEPLPEPVLEDMKARVHEEMLASPDGDSDDRIIFIWETYGSPGTSSASSGGETFWTVQGPTEVTDAVRWDTSDGTLAWANSEIERIVASTGDPENWRIRVLTGAG